ncbi:hypothetical protein ACHQM5_002021 [Ranunculus cassubicifolius]
MEGGPRNKETCPQLLDLWLMKGDENMKKNMGEVAEEKKLELRLAPPGEDWEDNPKAYGSFSGNPKAWLTNNGGVNQNQNYPSSEKHLGAAMYSSAPWKNSNPSSSTYLQFQSHPQAVKPMESSKTCCTKGVMTDLQQSQAEKKACSTAIPANTAMNNSSQKRSAPAPVVGWPPVRSFRKNLASNSSKPALDSQNNGDQPPKETTTNSKQQQQITNKGMFVKINMDGVPIGRKIDIKAYDSYEKLSTAVDELFRDLLAAQKDSGVPGNLNKVENVKEITGLLDGSGEYTLVYEDNEGDRMLVGDDPWEMFASTVMRLRVLKSSELSALRVGSGKQGKRPL